MSTLAGYLEEKAAALTALSAKLADPTIPPNRLAATARVAGGSGVRPVQVRQFTVVTDSGAALAGHDLGPSAPELLLTALASCVAHTFLIAAARRGVALETLEVTVSGSIDFRGVLEVDPDVPVHPTDLSYQARIGSAADDVTLAALQADVARLCPVLTAVTQPVTVAGSVVRI